MCVSPRIPPIVALAFFAAAGCGHNDSANLICDEQHPCRPVESGVGPKPVGPMPVDVVCDLATGADCGGCATACDPGWLCLGGSCGLVLATDVETPTSIVVDDTHVYWTADGSYDELENYQFNGTVRRVTVDGADRTTLVTGLRGPWSLVADATELFWLNCGPLGSAPGEVLSASKAGGEAVLLAASTHPIGDLAIDGSSVYWPEMVSPGEVRQVAKAGGTATSVVTNEAEIHGVVADAEALYWTSNEGTYRRTLGSSSSEIVAPNSRAFNSMNISGDALYWISYFGGPLTLRRAAVADGDSVTLAARGDPLQSVGAFGLGFPKPVADGARVYYAYSVQSQDGSRGYLHQSATSPNPSEEARLGAFRLGTSHFAVALAERGDFVYLALGGINTRIEGVILKIRK